MPDDLFLQAKRFAVERGTTLKALVESGLRNALAHPEPQHAVPYRLPVITAMSAPLGHQQINEVIDQMRNELWSADRDFSRFPGLRTRNPLRADPIGTRAPR